MTHTSFFELAGKTCIERSFSFSSYSLKVLCFTQFDEEVLSHINGGEEDWPVYGQVWPAALLLCETLAKQWPLWPTPPGRVLEIGCGLGLPSLLAAKLGAKVLASDRHSDVEEFMKAQRRSNSLSQSELAYERFDFHKADEIPESIQNWDPDLILASDILYEPAHYPAIIQTLISLMKPGRRLILADPGRVGLAEFHALMAVSGLYLDRSIQAGDGTWVGEYLLAS